MSEWIGLEIQLEQNTGNIITVVQDARETELVPINSSSGYYAVNQSVNLYDGNWHNILFMWACDDYVSFPNYPNPANGADAGTIALRKGVLAVDSIIIANTIPTSGKQTPLNFIHDWNNKLATYISIGGRTENAGSTSLASASQVIQPYSGMIQRMIVWDRPLGPATTTNIDTTVNVLPNGTSPSWWGNLVDWIYGSGVIWQISPGQSTFGNTLQLDPLSGTFFASMTGNAVIYYKFDELADGSTFARDNTGSAFLNVGDPNGPQSNPVSGNTINWIGSNTIISTGDYQLFDITDSNADGVMQTGIVVFQDNYGNSQPVGFINYDLGFVVLDGEFSESGGITGVPFLRSIGASGMSTTQSLSSNNFYVKKINFTSQKFVESLILNVAADGTEMNYTENPSGVNLKFPGAYPESVGLYNGTNDLIAIAKFSKSIRKDPDHSISAQIKLNFSSSYPGGSIYP